MIKKIERARLHFSWPFDSLDKFIRSNNKFPIKITHNQINHFCHKTIKTMKLLECRNRSSFRHVI